MTVLHDGDREISTNYSFVWLLRVWLAQSHFRILYNFEADNGICTGGCELRERSGTSNGLATLMYEEAQLFFQLKTEANAQSALKTFATVLMDQT